jgi:hypothetical protein
MVDTWLTHGLAIFYPSARFFMHYNYHSSRIICCSSRFFLNPVPEKAAITYNACYSFRVFAKPVPGLGKAPSIFQQPGIFDGTFVSLIVETELLDCLAHLYQLDNKVMFNAAFEERLELVNFLSYHEMVNWGTNEAAPRCFDIVDKMEI